MKKFDRFVKTIPMKLYILIAVLLIFAFFSNDFGLVDIQKTAVILAAGVDRTEEGFLLTAQIAVPKGTERSSCGTASIDVEGEGKTVAECVSQIYSKTGWVPKLIFCNLLLFGEETAEQDVIGCMDYFLRNEYMQDNCFVAVSEGSANGMLTTKSATEDTTSLAMEKLFSDAAGKSGKVMKNTLKEFAIGYYGESGSGFMPFIRAKDQDCGSESGGGAGSDASGSGGGSQSSSSAQGEEQKKIYSAEETAIFSNGKMVGMLPPEQTFTFSLLKGNVFSGTFLSEEDGKPVSVTVLKNKGGVKLDTKNKPKITLSVDLKIRLHNRGVPSPIEDVANEKVSDEVQQAAQERIGTFMHELWENCKTSGCDLFQLKRELYRSSPKKYGEWKDTLLTTADVEIKPNVKSIQ